MYLNEEVTDQVTSLQKNLKAERHLPGGEDEEGSGLEHATVKWNENVGVEKQKEQDKTKNGVLCPAPQVIFQAQRLPMTLLKLRLVATSKPALATLDR